MDLHALKFPVGEYQRNINPTDEEFKGWISAIASFPKDISNLVGSLNSEALHWCYRPDGWNIKQVVHHCADSHMNALIRVKLALTEEQPQIRPYEESKWAMLADGGQNDLRDSLMLLSGLHAKWVYLLQSLNDTELSRTFIHPEHGLEFSIRENIGNYAWHCKHHLAHIKNALVFKGKF